MEVAKEFCGEVTKHKQKERETCQWYKDVQGATAKKKWHLEDGKH